MEKVTKMIWNLLVVVVVNNMRVLDVTDKHRKLLKC